MTRSLAAALAIAAALPALAAPRQKVAVLDVRAVQGVEPGTATILTAIIAGDTGAAGYDVLSQADIGALIGFERQKKMLGCGDDSSCLAEIGGALGAEYVLSTQVGRIGSRFHLSLQLLDARKGNVVARVSTFSETNEDALAATAQKAVAQALAAARERAAGARPATAAAGAAAGATAATAKASTETATPAPTSTSTSASTAAGAAFARSFYVELRAGLGWNKVPVPTSPGTEPFDGPALGLRGGVKLAPAWAIEVGGGLRKLRHTTGAYETTGGGISTRFDTEDDVRGYHLGAGGVYSPPSVPWLAFAADVGFARYTFEHTVFLPSSFAPTPGTPSSVTERWTDTLPRFGLEARLDFPVRWVTLGLRAGVDFSKTSAREMPLNPFTIPPAGTAPVMTTWLESGWIVAIPVDLSVRYVF